MAQPINQALDKVLTSFGESCPVSAGSREFHQEKALQCAIQIRLAYSETTKKKARRECLGHLRASLNRPAATGQFDNNVRASV